MKILFSPSESKTDISPYDNHIKDELIFKNLFNVREYFIKKYDEIIKSGDEKTIKKLFGLKNIEDKKNGSLFEKKTQKALLRYNGVAYNYLDYMSLQKDEQNFLDNNVIIFSNLFGPIKGGDKIPEYKLKQGEMIDSIKPEKIYKEEFSTTLDNFLEDEFIVDLRAGFYEKFYNVTHPFITLKFIKNGKVVSHYSKAYRGLVLRELAKYKPINEDDFGKIVFNNLNLVDIKLFKNKKEYLFEIV